MNKNNALYLLIIVLACVSIMCVSCTKVAIFGPPHETKVGNGPPPHAPAHGYRAKQADGMELVFDSELGVYAVVGLADCYYLDGFYFRLQDGNWQMSVSIDGGWKAAQFEKLPPGLKAKGNAKGKAKGWFFSKGKAKGHGK
jgi:hypothetical protein